MQTLSIKQLQLDYAEKRYSATELCQQYLNHIKQADNAINSFISLCPDTALEQAKQADQQLADGNTSALTGVPIAHKDIFCSKGIKTSCGSKMLDNFIAPYDATVVTKLNQAGTITLGKTNMDEFAMGSANISSFYGSVQNPWDLSAVPGGSSGGSAAAVAANFCIGATGSDTGGSIRQPAAFCGITGIKPTYGSISRYGMIAFASSLDQAGPMARSAEDCAILLEAMVGQDTQDSTSIAHPQPDFTATLEQSIEGLKIGLPTAYFSEDLNSDIAQQVENCAKQLEQLGAQLVEVSLQHSQLAVPCYYVIAPAEASSNLSRYDGIRFGHRSDKYTNLDELYKLSRSEGFGDEVKRRIMVGTYALSAGYYDAYYVQAQKIRRLIRDEFVNQFKEVDLILSPTTPSTAFNHAAIDSHDPVQMYLSDLYTIAVNLAGLPALSMPCGFSKGLPVGTQLIANHFQEAKLLNVAHQYQQQTDFHLQSAPFLKGDAL